MAKGRQEGGDFSSVLPQASKPRNHHICSWRRRRRTFSRRVLGAAWPCQHTDFKFPSSGAEHKLRFFSASAETCQINPSQPPRQPQSSAESWLREADKPRGYSAGSHLLMTWQGLSQHNFLSEPEEVFAMRRCASLLT